MQNQPVVSPSKPTKREMLRRVERAVARVKKAQEDAVPAIIGAREAGASHNEIARAAGLAQQRIEPILSEHGID